MHQLRGEGLIAFEKAGRPRRCAAVAPACDQGAFPSQPAQGNAGLAVIDYPIRWGTPPTIWSEVIDHLIDHPRVGFGRFRHPLTGQLPAWPSIDE